MDNFSDILWIVLVGASILISLVSKNKEKQRKRAASADDGDTHTPTQPAGPWKPILKEVWPDMGTPEQPKPQENDEYQDDTSWETPQTQSRRHEEDAERMNRVPESIYSNLKRTAKTEKETAFTTLQAAQTPILEASHADADALSPISASPAQPEGPTSEIMEGFELRKAIVWAEILKPKFNEGSN